MNNGAIPSKKFAPSEEKWHPSRVSAHMMSYSIPFHCLVYAECDRAFESCCESLRSQICAANSIRRTS